MNTPSLRILLVDDHFVVRMGLASSLGEESDIEVVAEAGSCAEALEAVKTSEADLALIDMRLPDGDGAQLIRQILDLRPGLRCLVLSVNTGENEILQAVRAGANGYLSKAADRPELLKAIRAIAGGESYFPAAIQEILEKGTARSDLSLREFDVLERIVKGFLNKEIADQLGLAEITVKQHVSAILRKLEVQDRTQAAIAAVQRGLVRLEK